MANVKATDLIDFTRASKGHALAKVSYGEELVVNGGFDTDSDWTTQRVSIASGVADFSDNSSGPARIIQDNVYTVGKTYLVTFDVNTSGTLRVYDGSGYDGDISVSSGTVSKIIYAEGTQFIIRANVTNDYTGTIDNVSVKEVLFNQPDGTLQLFEHPNNIPRIEYDADGNLLGLLIEEARTNLETNSDRTGTAQNGSVTEANEVLTPAGTVPNAYTATSVNYNQFYYSMPSNCTIGTTYTASVFVNVPDKTAVPYLFFEIRSIANGTFVVFDTTNSSVFSTPSGVTASITSIGNNWYRVSVTATAAVSTNLYGAKIYLSTSTATPFTNGVAVGSKVYFFGHQVEAGSFPTSYIKTQGSTVSRAADVASIDVDQFGYNQSEGTLFVDFNTFNALTQNSPVSIGANSSNAMGIYAINSYQLRNLVANSSDVLLDNGTVSSAKNKIAGCYKLNNFAVSLNGNTASVDTSGAPQASPTTMYIGAFVTTNKFNGHIKSITYTPKRLSNAKLQELTS